MTAAFDFELYHVKNESRNGTLECYKLTDNGWNDKHKVYFLQRKDIIICENNDCFVV